MNNPVNLMQLDQSAMRDWFVAMGERPYRATQMMKWLYHRGETRFDAMTDIGQSLRGRLAETAFTSPPGVVHERTSADGTRKWLLRVDERNSVETVFIPEPDRGTLCISSQAGCPLDCGFCSTGKQGFNRNLTTAEIIGQLWLANRELGYFGHRNRIITNVVMMGMGEPLLNLDQLVPALQIMVDDLGFGLAHRRVTVSTAGMVPAMDQLADSVRVSLAVSLHAATNTQRDRLMPINRSYPVEQLIDACRRYAAKTGGDPITFEYVMLHEVNDSSADARRLAALLAGVPAKVNLIPFNPFPGAEYVRSTPAAIERFREILSAAGLVTITRRPRGEDIDAACGQLVGRVSARAARIDRNRPLAATA